MIKELGHAFAFYDHKSLHHKILKLRQTSNESITHFYDCFRHYRFEFPELEVS